MKTTVSSKGQIVLPAELRKKHGIKTGDELDVVELSGSIYLVPVAEGDPLDRLQGLLPGDGYSTEQFLAQRRADEEREKEKLKRWGL